MVPSLYGENHYMTTKHRSEGKLARKYAELSEQCDLDIIVLVYDRVENQIREMHTSPEMTLDDFKCMMAKDKDGPKRIQYKREYCGLFVQPDM